MVVARTEMAAAYARGPARYPGYGIDEFVAPIADRRLTEGGPE